MARLNFVYGFIGVNRCGKSSVARKLANAWKQKNPDGLIVSHDPQNNFEEITDVFIYPDDEDWAAKCCNFRNCLIILDDVRLIHESDRLNKDFARLLYFRAKYNIDIITIFHNPSLVLSGVAAFITHYFIFLTSAQEGSFKKKIPNYSLCIAASEEVNKYVSIYGRGKYPHFPYVVVDSERQKLMAVNMDKKISKIGINQVNKN